MRLHQSELSSWSRCPQQTKLETSGGFPREQLSPTAAGSLAHYVLLNILEQGLARGDSLATAKKAAAETFDYYWDTSRLEAVTEPVTQWLPRQGWHELRERFHKALDFYIEHLELERDDQLLATEYSFSVPIPGTWDDLEGKEHVLVGTADKVKIGYRKRIPTLILDDLKFGRLKFGLRWNQQFTAYCVSPDTPILMADYSWRKIGDARVGDEIVGVDEFPTLRESGKSRRHWRSTTIDAKWIVRKQAYRLHLNDGTTLTVGEGHRLLAVREGGFKWRTVEDMLETLHSPRRRTDGIRLARAYEAPGQQAVVDRSSDDYMAGYIAGATLGDGCLSIDREIPFWSIGLGSGDRALLDRLAKYLHHFGISVNEWSREPDGRGWQKSLTQGLKTQSRSQTDAIHAMCTDYPETNEYFAGWLAGLFDTDGSIGGQSGTIIFHQKDVSVLRLVIERAKVLGFDFRLAARSAELVGDRTRRVSFTELIDPALRRKRQTMEGHTLRIFGDVRIMEIEDLGVQDLIDITTGTATYIANGIVSHNCLASNDIRFWVGADGEDGFGEEFGTELYEKTKGYPRFGRWISLSECKVAEAGYRGPIDYQRFAIAVEQVVASMRADIYPLNISGDTCGYCPVQTHCAGVGVPTWDHGAPGAV